MGIDQECSYNISLINIAEALALPEFTVDEKTTKLANLIKLKTSLDGGDDGQKAAWAAKATDVNSAIASLNAVITPPITIIKKTQKQTSEEPSTPKPKVNGFLNDTHIARFYKDTDASDSDCCFADPIATFNFFNADHGEVDSL